MESRPSVTEAKVTDAMMVLPILQGGGSSGIESSLSGVPASLSLKSDVRYRPEDFPAARGLKNLLEMILLSEGVPREMAALVWVESSFNAACHSRTGAAGPWQLMPTTARELGLEVNDEVDERYSWVESTRAAARYLRNLHKTFGDWSLAVAAYNCGPGRMMRGLKNGGCGFGEIDLPGETDAFVPRFAAAAEAYAGIEDESCELAVIWVPANLDLRLLAAEIGMNVDTLMNLNMAYLKERTPRGSGPWTVVVPEEYAERAFPAAWKMDPQRYAVREGDTWETVAASLGVSKKSLMDMNPAGSMEPGNYLEIPESRRRPVNRGVAGNPRFFRYTVRMGDTLGGIGASVGVSSREVAAWNGISPDAVIYPGDVLMLRRPESAEGSDTGGADKPTLFSGPETDIVLSDAERVVHTVIKGDTLWDIALKYGVSIEQIMYLNSLEDSHLSLGEVLVIFPGLGE